jgi:hypothetical protein
MSTRGTDLLQASSEYVSQLEGLGVEPEVTVLISVSDSPTIIQSTAELDAIGQLLDLGKLDLLVALRPDLREHKQLLSESV